MSWCRWGSPCSLTIPLNEGCGMDPCPGSDLYIYESDEGFVCCACKLAPRDDVDRFDHEDFVTKTEAEMEQHCRDHVAAGHHVRPSLYDEEFRKRQEALRQADIEKHGEMGAVMLWARQGMAASDAHSKAMHAQMLGFFSWFGGQADLKLKP